MSWFLNINHGFNTVEYKRKPIWHESENSIRKMGVKYEYSEQDLRNKGPMLLEMNPVCKKVPVLIHNGKPICESLIVVQYIDEVWNNKSPLLPSDPYHRAQSRFWAYFVDNKGKLIAWCKRCMKNESVSKSLADPQEVYGFLVELRKKLGLE